MIEVCRFCLTPKIKPGPRNKKVIGYCGGVRCRVKALKYLSEVDLLNPLEQAELDQVEAANDKAAGG